MFARYFECYTIILGGGASFVDMLYSVVQKALWRMQAG